jgi:hypothetical protein
VLEGALRNNNRVNFAAFEPERNQALDDGWSELAFYNPQNLPLTRRSLYSEPLPDLGI